MAKTFIFHGFVGPRYPKQPVFSVHCFFCPVKPRLMAQAFKRFVPLADRLGDLGCGSNLLFDEVSRKLKNEKSHNLSRWWFHFFLFSPLFGEDSHFD